MQKQETTERAFQVLSERICETAVKADLERKLFLKAGYPKAAESLGAMMMLIWKLFRSCRALHKESARLRGELLAIRETIREAIREEACFDDKVPPSSTVHLN